MLVAEDQPGFAFDRRGRRGHPVVPGLHKKVLKEQERMLVPAARHHVGPVRTCRRRAAVPGRQGCPDLAWPGGGLRPPSVWDGFLIASPRWAAAPALRY